MGGGNVKRTNLKPFELQDFQSMTSLPNDILIDLHKLFNSFCNSIKDDGVIDYQEFLIMIEKNDCTLTKHLFRAIDINKDNCVNFREFLKFVCCFITGTFEEQSVYTFKIFANDETKLIEKSRMVEFIRSCLQIEKTLSEYLNEKSLDDIVKISFEKLNIMGDEDSLNFEQYKKFLEKYPNILNWFKLDLNKIKNNLRDKTRSTTCFG